MFTLCGTERVPKKLDLIVLPSEILRSLSWYVLVCPISKNIIYGRCSVAFIVHFEQVLTENDTG